MKPMTRWTTAVLVASFLLAAPLLTLSAWAAEGDLLWATEAGGEFRDQGNGVAVDAVGNAVVTGSFTGTATFGPGEVNETTLIAAGEQDIYIAKYSPEGTLLWAKRAGGGGSLFSGHDFYDSGNSVAVDGAGNAIVAGSFAGSATFGPGEANETTLTAYYEESSRHFGDVDAFVAKYTPQGTLLWAKQGGALWADAGLGVAADPDGNVVLTGFSLDARGNEAWDEGFIAKYASDGAWLWEKRMYYYEAETVGYGVAVDAAGDAVVTGCYFAYNDPDYFVAKYAPDGALLWFRGVEEEYGGASVCGYGVAVDLTGSAVVTGGISGTATFGLGEENETTLTADGPFVARYTAEGSLLWAEAGAGGSAVALDAAGAPVVTGETVAKYAPDGNLLWARTPLWAEGGGRFAGVAVDAGGNAVVTGTFTGTAIFGSGEVKETTLAADGDSDVVIAKYAGPQADELPDLAVTIGANPGLIRVGAKLTYSVTVVNRGLGPATEVVVREHLPSNTETTSLPGQCQITRGRVARCLLGTLAAGAERQLQIVVRPRRPGVLVNRACTKAAEPDLNPRDNCMQVRTPVTLPKRPCGKIPRGPGCPDRPH